MIKVSHLNKTYDRGSLRANRVLHDISFELPETGFVCILGASGCGKTSLLNAIGGLDAFDNGTISTGAVEASRYGTAGYEAERNKSFGYIFQNYYLLMDHSVGYNVYLGLHNLDLTHSEKLRRVKAALKEVEMERYIRRTVGELSGGQQQRVAIARALARRPRVIFADEPTGNLDEANTLKICTLLRKISRRSLVVMVTHEQRLANFFADRIITLDAGRIQSDTTDWQRQEIPAETGKTVYAGEYEETVLEAEGIRLRLLREQDAAPVELTLVAEQGRIVLKLDDFRTVTLGRTDMVPALKEGKRPVLSLEILDREADRAENTPSDDRKAGGRSGQGISFSMMLQEARRLSSAKGGLQGAGMKLFLVLLTVLAMVIVSDYLTVAALDPEDFITSDPHILEITLDYGPNLTEEDSRLSELEVEYLAWLRENRDGFYPLPNVSTKATFSEAVFLQIDSQQITFSGFSYVPLQYLDESTLIEGRLPENSMEIVVDRWVLEKALEGDGILENSIPDVSYFLGKTITFYQKDYTATIVGICDGGSPAAYMNPSGLLSIGVGFKAVITLDELQAQFPGEYDDLVLGEGECAVNADQAGIFYINRVGSPYRATNRTDYTIVSAFKADTYASVIVTEETLEDMMWDISSTKFYLYCEDTAAVKQFLKQGCELETQGYLSVTVRDRYTQTMNAYREASTLKADGRTIITVTVIALAMVMLYLLCRARTQQRLGMLAVYRLLGIPNGKLAVIFTLESVLTSLTTSAPAALLTWAAVELAKLVPEWGISMLLPWQAALGVYAAILVYHILVSLLPMARLLGLPPAQLAAKYDI